MLNDIIDIFIGLFNHVIVDLLGMELTEFDNYNHYVACICIVVTIVIPSGAFCLLCTVVSECFKTIRGSIK